MKTAQRISLGASLLIGIFLFVALYPSNAKADPAGITITPTDTPEVTDTPTEPPPPPPDVTVTPTVTPTEELPPPPDVTNTPPPRPKASKTPEPLLPETGQNPIDPFQGSGLLLLGVLTLLGVSGGLVLGISLNAKKRAISKDS